MQVLTVTSLIQNWATVSREYAFEHLHFIIKKSILSGFPVRQHHSTLFAIRTWLITRLADCESAYWGIKCSPALSHSLFCPSPSQQSLISHPVKNSPEQDDLRGQSDSEVKLRKSVKMYFGYKIGSVIFFVHKIDNLRGPNVDAAEAWRTTAPLTLAT